ncbi:MAG: prepilin-type N-terminal cleavage/methylation domain-containing protein, partial [Syntrophomonadaceae bacterium]|nr:prepilin-type N-terminal cleavage/methylation domain-containing protein [Syntrophomonadaceae bacterium]
MKTRVKSHLKNKKGLTLMETLIAVAIVVILLGVAFIGIQGLVDRINQTKLDNVAQSMYVSAQNRIRELKASGEIDRLLTI